MIKINKGIKIFRTETVMTHALHQVDVDITVGEFVSIMGPSGSGKTTLLNIIGMLEALDSGRYLFNGTDIANMSYRERLVMKREHISFIFQSFNLIPNFTVLQNVELPLKYQGMTRAKRRDAASCMLEKLAIAHRKDHFPGQLSGGEQQRVAIARAAVTNPLVILADEPTGNLDTATGELVLDKLKDLNNNGTTVIMVTHSDEASKIAGRCMLMRDGCIVSARP